VAFAAAGTTVDESPSNPASLHVPWIDPDGVAPVVGSLDVNPADDSLWLATNTGLWRLKPGADQPEGVTGLTLSGSSSAAAPPARSRARSPGSSSRTRP
jgi:hypothetical protein